jgi:hypothetical protein
MHGDCGEGERNPKRKKNINSNKEMINNSLLTGVMNINHRSKGTEANEKAKSDLSVQKTIFPATMTIKHHVVACCSWRRVSTSINHASSNKFFHLGCYCLSLIKICLIKF